MVIGATGHFGGRLCRRLVGEPNAEVLVTSRSLAKAQALADDLMASSCTAVVKAARLDQDDKELAADLLALRPDIVIHTAGPYQGQDYRVAKACIQARSHYIDLADGRDFVQGFASLHDDAQRNGVLLICGASTLPGLSSVVIDSLRAKFSAIRTIEMSIAPAHQTPRGQSTIAAVLSYCGQSFRVLVDGEWVTKYGWHDLTWHRHKELGLRLGGACDVPDLGLLPDYVEGVSTVTFHAALEAKWEQLALWNMGWLTRIGVIKNWDRFVPLLQTFSDRLIGLGSDMGGMHITITGLSEDHEIKSVTWSLLAQHNHGPEIPCSPALILARKLVADKISATGAKASLGLFSMSDFEQELSDFDVSWETNES